MIKFHTGLMRTNLEYIVIVFIMYQDRHFQTGEFLRKASKNNEETRNYHEDWKTILWMAPEDKTS